jgi:hypothetical protein
MPMALGLLALMVAGCIANVTDVRTKELKTLEDAMSN